MTKLEIVHSHQIIFAINASIIYDDKISGKRICHRSQAQVRMHRSCTCSIPNTICNSNSTNSSLHANTLPSKHLLKTDVINVRRDGGCNKKCLVFKISYIFSLILLLL